MAVSRVGIGEFGKRSGSRGTQKWSVLANTFLITMSILTALDLMLAYLSGDTLVNYTISVLMDLTISGLGLVFCRDLVTNRDQESRICFLAYMVFLWTCISVLKLVF
ncbi:hypothetical protein [Desulfosporosinus meridiei]|uniref:Uncharacterized protein n=1 Tax=Desulfosporosinus meridiei (strain ATCC BAA-275 / DSM 13257 / KCTC 12902 / NCIMB 13706 / S10) TaxID=768704 RepID=J7IVI1_DESMD|nr:hypothetical protein [Desulfosporosinus meridiei]AFQ44169.1 hypothetical protein Desmer_2231 [Desulfosporosinus meridiei DSM 13257]